MGATYETGNFRDYIIQIRRYILYIANVYVRIKLSTIAIWYGILMYVLSIIE